MGVLDLIFAAIVVGKLFGIEPVASWPWLAIVGPPLALAVGFAAVVIWGIKR